MSLLQKQWHSKGIFNEGSSLFENFLLLNNKKETDFSSVSFSDLSDPFSFKDAKKACEIVFECIEKKERILVFGDYDLDGMSGTAQIYLTLKSLGADVSYRLPSRTDGYGLSVQFIEEAHDIGVKLFITTDCGVSNISEITRAKELGMKTIITDHHSVGDVLPPADAILHPLVEDETFTDKDLTGAGVAWFFCTALLRYRFGEGNTDVFEHQLLEFSVLGTVADCGPLRGQNRVITMLGIEQIKKTENKGLLALLESSGTQKDKLNTESIGFFIAPRLNASGRLAHPKISLELLLGDAQKCIELEELNTRRQQMVEGFLEEASVQVLEQMDKPCIIVSSPNWPSGIIGLISGRIAEQTGKPTIAFEEKETKITGSCRGPEGFNIAKGLKCIQSKNPEYFYGCGGHAQAAGLSLYPQYFNDFKKEFQSYTVEKRGDTPSLPQLEYLGEIHRNIIETEVEELQKAQPFGIGNPSPSFLFASLKIIKLKSVGKDKSHLSFFFASTDRKQTYSGIFFREADKSALMYEGMVVDVVAVPEVNEWKDKKSISLKIRDIKI